MKLTSLTLTFITICLISFLSYKAEADWLVEPTKIPARVEKSADGKELVLTNGLISRRFRLVPDAATIAFDNLMTGQSMLRGVKPEAQIEIDGVTFNVGGLKGQPNYAYLLDQWIEKLQADEKAFGFCWL